MDTGRSCSLTLRYAQQDAAFPGLEIRIYRVAQFHADGTYERVEPYASWPVNLQGITSQKQWQDAASAAPEKLTGGEAQLTLFTRDPYTLDYILVRCSLG